jgi:type IV secretion system protein VirB4
MMKLGIYRNSPRKRLFGITEYDGKPSDLTDLLPWAFLLEPGLIINKDGSFMKVITYRGPDLDSSSNSQLIAARGQVNNALRRLGSGWCVHIEARRSAAPNYPTSNFPDPISAAFDKERQRSFEHRTIPAFESDYFMTFTYLPPEENIGRAEALLTENMRKSNSDSAYTNEKLRFVETVRSLMAILEGFMPLVREMGDQETLTYLHDCISENTGVVAAVPQIPFGLDALLRDTPLTGGFEPMLGRLHMRTIGVNAFPDRSSAGLLDALNSLPFAYRWVTRYIPLDKTDAEKILKTMRQRWFDKRKGIWTMIREAISAQETLMVDEDAVNKANEAGAALEALGADLTSFGFFTPTIIVTDTSLEILDWKVGLIKKLLDQQGLYSTLETTNAVEAWLSSLPGHAYANCRRPILSALNVIDLMPFSAVWAGPTRNEHLNGPPLLMAKTTGSTPFRLVLHQGDVGHTMIVGPTGSGKSALLNTIALQFRRYKDAQIFIFDKGASARASTLLVGGQFYPLGDDAAPITLQPLAEIDQIEDRVWATEWLVGVIEAQRVVLTPELKSEIWTALNNLAARPVRQRTITVFRSLIQNTEIKGALQPFTLEGPHGSLLDAAETNIGESNWQCFEMEALYNRPQAISPTLGYLFHRLENKFDGRPTMLILDEAWLFLDDPTFAAKIREWLKTLRRRNVSVIFASQSLADIQSSSIAPALIENCPQRIYLPNDKAMEPMTAQLYRMFGLSEKQLQLISQATPKREYYIQTAAGNRMFELGLSRFAITVAATSSKTELRAMDDIIARHGIDNFRREFLAAHGFNPETMNDMTIAPTKKETRYEPA